MTIKNLITFFRQFTTQHPILKTFSWGNLSDYSREDYITEYPAIHFVPQPSTLGDTSQDITFSVLIYDLLNEYVDNPINSNQLDSMALCEEILGDFYNYFVNQLSQYGYYLQTPIQYSYFTDRFAESVCGVEGQITITIEQTACIPPSLLPVPVQPDSVSNLFAWYDFQDSSTITLTGGTDISQVLDKSGNDYTLTPKINPPTYQQVGSGNLSPFYAMYDTNDTRLQHDLLTPLSFTDYTIFVVSDYSALDSIRSLFTITSGDTFSSPFDIRQYGFGTTRLTGSYYYFGGIQNSIPGGSINPLNNAFISTQKGELSVSNNVNLYGVNNYVGTNQTSFTLSATTFDTIMLGENLTTITPTPYDINICEVIMYDRELTDDEYNGVLAYLKDKYRQPFWN